MNKYTRNYKSCPYRNEWQSYDDLLKYQQPLIFTYLSVNSVSNRIEAIDEYGADAIVLDESHMIKNPSGKASKSMALIDAEYKYILTGTPMDRDRHELWAQWRFCYPQLFGTKWTKFRDEWCNKDPIYNKGQPIPHVFRLSLKHKKIPEFDDIMKPYNYTATKDVIGIRDPEYICHEFDMPTKTQNIYNELKKHLVVQYDDSHIIADSIGAELVRLQQLTSGIIVTENGDVVMNDYAKIQICQDMINLHNEPAVVFCRFVKEKDELIDRLQKSGKKVVEISGKRKQDWSTEWDVVVAQIQAGGMSIDLTRSRYAYFLSKTYSHTDFFQCVSRIHRSGQNRWVKIWSIEARNSIDKLISEMIQLKKSNIKLLFDLLKRSL